MPEKYQCWRSFLNKNSWSTTVGLQLYSKEKPAQVFSREFGQIFGVALVSTLVKTLVSINKFLNVNYEIVACTYYPVAPHVIV